MMRTGLFVAALALASGPAAADWMKQGMKAHEEKDYAQAMKYFEMESSRGMLPGRYQLGLMYLEGQGVAADEQRAFELFRSAARPWAARFKDKAGYAEAQYMAGLMLRDGRGTVADAEAAVKQFRRAANQGHAEAQLALAEMLLAGSGIESDPLEAAAWLKLAQDQLDGEARDRAARAMKEASGRLTEAELSQIDGRAEALRLGRG